jgi:hypothetical protein
VASRATRIRWRRCEHGRMMAIAGWWGMTRWYVKNRKAACARRQAGWRMPRAVMIGPEAFEESSPAGHATWPRVQELEQLLRASSSSSSATSIDGADRS